MFEFLKKWLEEDVKDISAREALSLKDSSLILPDDKVFNLIWKDLSKLIRERATEGYESIEFQINTKKYLKANKSFVSDNIEEFNKFANKKFKAVYWDWWKCGSYGNKFFITNFIKNLSEKIKSKGFKVEHTLYYKASKTIPDGIYMNDSIEQKLIISWNNNETKN